MEANFETFVADFLSNFSNCHYECHINLDAYPFGVNRSYLSYSIFSLIDKR